MLYSILFYLWKHGFPHYFSCRPHGEVIFLISKFLLRNSSYFVLQMMYNFFFFFFFLVFLETHPQHMESELQLLADTTATAMQDPSHICDLHCSSWQCQILNPLGEARDRTCALMDASRIHFHCATSRTPNDVLLTSMVQMVP